ncbi:MAG TPA: response regulator [Treponemataceae bacterium]|nr:response regulator [Treponemataceae bacterium]
MPSRRSGIPALIVLFFTLQISAEPAQTVQEKVRICLFESKNFFELDESNTKSGYAYEFLQEISKYTHWQYEYSTYNGPWETQAEKLKNGEIDILTRSITASGYDESSFTLSDSPLVITSAVLVTNPENAGLWKNAPNKGTLIIGIATNSYYEEQIKQFCTDKGFTVKFTYFTDENALNDALHIEKTVHAILTLKPFESSQELLIAEFEPYEMYFLVNNKNTRLLSELNKAMAMIDRYSTAIRSTLNKKYMEYKENDGAFSITLDEYFFLEDYKKTKPGLQAMMTPERKPISYFESGEPKGICWDIINSAIEHLELNVSIIETKTQSEYFDTIRGEKPGIILTRGKDLAWAEQEGYRFTDPYMSLYYSSLQLKDYTPEFKKAAVIDGPRVLDNYIKARYTEDQIIRCNTIEECIESLINKEASIVFLDSYTAHYYLDSDYKRQLEDAVIPGLQWDLCVAVHNSLDARLFSILNKAVRNISAESLYTAIQLHTHTHEKDGMLSIPELLYTKPLRFVVMVISPFLLVVLLGLYIYSIRTQKKVLSAMEEKSQFGLVLCSSFDTVCEWNLDDNTIQYFFYMQNQLVKQKDFFTVTEYIDHAQKNVVHPEDKESFAYLFSTANLETLLARPRTLYKEFRLFTPGSKNKNSYEWNAVTLQAFTSHKQKRSFIICTKNIDDVKHSEDLKNEQLKEALNIAEKANKSKSAFLSRMSHEIRTPLNAILGFITLAKRTITEPQKSLDYISKSEYASKHLLSLINDILDMSAIESGKMKINEAEFEFKDFISSLAATFYGQAKLKNIRFSTILSNITEEYLCGDQVRLNQILMNILSNAIKFTPVNGEVSLIITQRLIKEKTVYMQFVVSDTGIGMSLEFLKKIGKPFEQESVSIAQEFGGSGLGISISRNLIQAMNGSMTIQSTENKGSVFSIEIPLGLVNKENPLAVHSSYEGKQVLIITMDKDLGDYEKQLFKACGVNAHISLSIDEVHQHVTADHTPCSLCIIDVDIPHGDQLMFIEDVKNIVPDETPLAVLSYDFSLLEEQARELHIEHFVQKPLFQSTVLNLLISVLGDYQTTARPEASFNFKGKHILLAEDNDFNREIAVDILSTQGFLVDTVKNGMEAVSFFEKSPINFYDLVLLDIQMPVLNGHEASKKIRSLSRPDAQLVPVIAMTANAFAEDVAAALSSGMNDHIAKPIDTRTLFSVLQRYIPG